MNKINVPKSWALPKYHLGQRVKQGEIIGVPYHPPGTQRAYELGDGWSYTVLPDEFSEDVEIYEEDQIETNAAESQRKINKQINLYKNRISSLAEQLEQ